MLFIYTDAIFLSVMHV